MIINKSMIYLSFYRGIVRWSVIRAVYHWAIFA